MHDTTQHNEKPQEQRANILLVDDQPANLLTLEVVLEDLGQNLVRAPSGEEALRQLLVHSFAVILLDVRMPGLSGFETARLVRGRKRSRHTPIIFLTANDAEDFSVVEAYKLGAVDYLVKPLVPEILRAKVSVFVELYQKARQIEHQAQLLRLAEQEQAKRRALAQYAIAGLLAESATLAEAGPKILKAACETFGWDLGALWTVDRPDQLLRCAEIWQGPQVPSGEFGTAANVPPLPLGVGLPGRVVVCGESVWVEDLASSEGFATTSWASRHGLQSAFALPVRLGSEVLGVMEFFSRIPRPTDDDQLRALSAISSQVGQFLERKRAENALRESEARKAAILRAALDAILTIDGDGKVVDFNPAAESLFGYTHAEAVGKELRDLLLPARENDPDRLAGGLVPGSQALLNRRQEMAARRKDGTEFSVELAVTGLDSGDRPLYTAFIQDITARKEAESRLRESEERFRTLADSMPQLAWMTGPDGRILWYNQRWYDYTGTSFDQMEGGGWHSVIDPEALPRVVTTFQKALSEGEPWEDTFPLRRHDGVLRWHLSRAIPLRDGEGAVVRWFGTNTDITDRREMEEALRRVQGQLEVRVRERTADLASANEALWTEIRERKEAEERVHAFTVELQRSNKELEQFASVASHDLQEPLRKIQAFGDRLQARCGEQLGEQGREYLDRMRAAAGRMRTLIDDLLAYSRVTTKSQPFVRVDLGAEARHVISDLEGRLQDTAGRVEVGDLPTIQADPTQMRQLLQNLIGNGLKFRRKDEPPVVKVAGRLVPGPTGGAAGEGADLCEITVEDNGIGFEEKYLDRIFQLFQRLHGRTEYEGTGIGLAICRKIVERHGGTITARSQPGQGATFVVTLPVRQGFETGVPQPLPEIA